MIRAFKATLIAVTVGAATLGTGSTTALAAPNCGAIVEHRKPEIPFRAFERKNPATGERYLPNELIEVSPGKKLPAKQFFDELDDTEAKLNGWGYSLRGGGGQTLSELVQCKEVLDNQYEIAKKSSKEGEPLIDPKKWVSDLSKAWEKYKKDIPDWDTLWKKAADEDVKVWMPEVPPYSAPAPTLERPEMKDFVKERLWPFEFGDKKTMHVRGELGLSVHSSKVEAKAHAHGTMWGTLLGGGEKELLGVVGDATSPGSGPGSFEATIRVVGKELFRHKWRELGLKLEEDSKLFDAKASMDFRFAIGPIPMKAEVGFRGTGGMRFGTQLVPLQMAAWATPYVSTDAYAQVALDLGIAGGGVGGALVLIRDEVPMKAIVNVVVGDEPSLLVTLDGRSKMTCLSGELYAFAYINYLFGEWRERWPFFTWTGFVSDANLFHVDWRWGPSGVTASGDLTADDVTEIQETNAELRAVAMENKASQLEHDVLSAISDDLASPMGAAPAATDAQMKVLAAGVDDVAKQYWAELRKWIQP